MRLIDIEPFESETDVTTCQIQRWHSGEGYQNVVTTATKDIPTIEAEPVKHGRWELVVYKPIGHDYFCSLCNFAACNEHSYCPNCGAKMDLED